MIIGIASTAPFGAVALAGAEDAQTLAPPAETAAQAGCTAAIPAAGELETSTDSGYGTVYRIQGTYHWMR